MKYENKRQSGAGNMKEIVKLWSKFTTKWSENPDNQIKIEGVMHVRKPEFYDFMQWLSRYYENLP